MPHQKTVEVHYMFLPRLKMKKWASWRHSEEYLEQLCEKKFNCVFRNVVYKKWLLFYVYKKYYKENNMLFKTPNDIQQTW